MLENVSIILVEPSGDENVGMAARAMKNSGITDLRLVNPAPFRTRGAKKWALTAGDILHRAKVFSSLEKASSDATFVVGLSRREGKLRPPSISNEKAASIIYARTKKGRVALVFGREADGLDRSELDLCDMVWTIPTSKLYPSLNLAQAVMVAGHEIYKKSEARSSKLKAERDEDVFVSKKEIAPVLKRISHALIRLGYDDADGGKLRKKIVGELEKLFGRGGLFHKDLNMFLGLCAQIEKRANQ